MGLQGLQAHWLQFRVSQSPEDAIHSARSLLILTTWIASMFRGKDGRSLSASQLHTVNSWMAALLSVYEMATMGDLC